MSDEENQFDAGDAGSADTTPCAYGSIKKGGYCMLKGFPCKVTEYSTAKPGKHGSAKATVVGIDIFTNKKYEDTAPTSATARVPNVTKVEYECVNVNEDDHFTSLVKADGTLKEDLKLPIEDEELFNELIKVWETRGESEVYFSVISACGKEKIVSGRKKE